ncbi:hypothetical protein K470DRAFT_101062 [Piedraia hortae CBS 480.64]|uniref:Uncharacterized protein n=1 Tax=Piedraia hortae CBS 480.64 TaxID=1314780 RepID=A0A6A7BVI2_9PEZI|nr:hypothetical protein K470DRAFT_101062 [Piedraia hortae CBS 480.64]
MSVTALTHGRATVYHVDGCHFGYHVSLATVCFVITTSSNCWVTVSLPSRLTRCTKPCQDSRLDNDWRETISYHCLWNTFRIQCTSNLNWRAVGFQSAAKSSVLNAPVSYLPNLFLTTNKSTSPACAYMPRETGTNDCLRTTKLSESLALCLVQCC